MSLLKSSKKEHANREQIAAFVRSTFGLIGFICFVIAVIFDINFSAQYLAPLIGTTMALVLAIGLGSAFEIVGASALFDADRKAALTPFERKLLYVAVAIGYLFDIGTNYGEMLRVWGNSTLFHSGPDIVIAVIIIAILGIILSLAEYLVAVCFAYFWTNFNVWGPNIFEEIKSWNDRTFGDTAEDTKRFATMQMKGSGSRAENDTDRMR